MELFHQTHDFPISLAMRHFVFWHVHPQTLCLVQSIDPQLLCAFVDAQVPFVVLLDNSAKKDLESADLHRQVTRCLETKSRLSMHNLNHLWVGYTTYERNMCTTGLSTSYMQLPADSKVTALQLAVRQEPVVQRRHNTKINTDAYKFHVKKCYLRDAPDSRANSFTDQAKLTRQTTQVGVFVNADCKVVDGEKL